MRSLYLVCYDIADDDRRNAVYKALRGFGDHLQYSVFRCDLSERERAELVAILSPLIDHAEDQVLIVDLGPSDGRARDCFSSIGRGYTPPVRVALVI